MGGDAKPSGATRPRAMSPASRTWAGRTAARGASRRGGRSSRCAPCPTVQMRCRAWPRHAAWCCPSSQSLGLLTTLSQKTSSLLDRDRRVPRANRQVDWREPYIALYAGGPSVCRVHQSSDSISMEGFQCGGHPGEDDIDFLYSGSAKACIKRTGTC